VHLYNWLYNFFWGVRAIFGCLFHPTFLFSFNLFYAVDVLLNLIKSTKVL
jgi:hypothetical protein